MAIVHAESAVQNAFPARLARELARLLPLTAAETNPRTPVELHRLHEILKAALLREERRAEASHWAYERARHAHLRCAYIKVGELLSMIAAAEQPPKGASGNRSPAYGQKP